MTQFRTRKDGTHYPINSGHQKTYKKKEIAGPEHINELKEEMHSLGLKQIKITGYVIEGDEWIYVLYDTPREIRHSDEYFGPGDEEPQWIDDFEKEDNDIRKILSLLEKEHPGLHYSTAKDITTYHDEGLKRYQR